MGAAAREAAPNIATAAALIGEPGRAAMLWSLIGGERRPAGELASIAGVSPQAASAHLARMTDGGLLRVEARGRHRFFSLAGEEVAAVLEALAGAATAAPGRTRLCAHVPAALRDARRCWGHLAGATAVGLHDALLERRWLTAVDDRYDITREGRQGLAGWGVDVGSLKPGRRGLAFPCLDWSERRPHLGGPLARAILDAALAEGWLRATGPGRALTITAKGERGFGQRMRTAIAA